jgi:hypothetical protein
MGARMSASQRTKGQCAEREVCALLNDAFGTNVKRILTQTREGGHDIDLPPFRIEVKRRKRVALLYEAMAQASGVIFEDVAAPTAYTMSPVVALRADGKEWLVVMKLPDWIKLAREEIACTVK